MLYGLLADLWRPIRVKDGEEDMRCRPRSNLSRPLFFSGASAPFSTAPSLVNVRSGTVGFDEVLGASSMVSGSAIMATVPGPGWVRNGKTRRTRESGSLGSWVDGGEESRRVVVKEAEREKDVVLGSSHRPSNCDSGLARRGGDVKGDRWWGQLQPWSRGTDGGVSWLKESRAQRRSGTPKADGGPLPALGLPRQPSSVCGACEVSGSQSERTCKCEVE
jgi:hypothetical protein